jgi:putative phosphoribosyl transferase
MTTSVTMAAGERSVSIPAEQGTLPGTLAWPTHPSGIVLFAHGSGSGRLSPRNRYVARQLRAAGLATLLFDLLTEAEAADRANVFDIPLLARRLLAAVPWVANQPEVADLPIGLFGASTGAAAALTAAAMSPESVAAVVSRGGRPDLAGNTLPRVLAPTLLLVGSRDEPVLGLNRQALAKLTCPKRLVVIPGASHLFEEPGTLADASRWAAEWFVRYLAMERRWCRRTS